MAISTFDQVGRLIRGREVQFKAVVVTALCSYFLQLIGIFLGWPLWAIALGTILPWVPLLTMKVLWTSKHYGFMAIYLVIMILQAGHVAEHVTQMLQFIFINNPNAIGLGGVLTPCVGWSWQGACGDAHGVFGALNTELVHFVWDGLILIACIVLRIHFRKVKNVWLTLAVVAAAIHQVEHIYLYGVSIFANPYYLHGGMLLGINVKSGAAGILAHNGLVGSAIPAINAILPGRINIHFIYNVLVFIPMVLAFRLQVRRIYDEWLAKAMPQLSEEQLIAATAQAENVKFAPEQIVFRQGDPADKFYIITKGQVDVLRADKKGGSEMQVARLAEGQYFGEIGVLGRTERTATIKAVTEVECLALNREVFKSLLAASSSAYKDMDVVLRRRLVQLGALQGLSLQDTVNADSDTVLKSRIIRDRLKMLGGEDLSRILGRTPTRVPEIPVAAEAEAVRRGQGVAVAERPAPSPVAPFAPVPQPVRPTSASIPPEDQPTLPRPLDTSAVGNGFYRGMLLVRSGPSAGLRFEITAPRIIIGRRSGDSVADVPIMQIDDARISRHHLEIFARADGMYVRDLGSANGSWLNGRQLGGEPVRLEDGAEIMVGPDSMLNFRVK